MKVEGWVNLFDDELLAIYPTKDKADRAAILYEALFGKRLACVFVRSEQGKEPAGGEAP